MDTNAGGGGNFQPPPSLTADFPDREPERVPEVNQDFEQASFTDHQHEQDKAMLAHLEAGRAKLEPNMHLRPGGDMADITQAVNTNIEFEREAEVKELQARIERHNQRKRGRGR
jgi:hypothetical protein